MNRSKFSRKLKCDGDFVASQFVVFFNNYDEPRIFNSEDELKAFYSSYLVENEIFALKVYRMDTYSLINQ